MSTPDGIRTTYQRRVEAINNRRNLPEQTRKALIAQAWTQARGQLRRARADEREQAAPTEQAPADEPQTMSDLIRSRAGRPNAERQHVRQAVAFGLPAPRELAGLQVHEIERLAEQADHPDEAA